MTIVDSSTADTITSQGVVVTSGATAHTKGDWQEMIASASEEVYWINMILHGREVDESYLVDVGIGALGAEVVKIANIQVFGNTYSGGSLRLNMPLTIASGSRVSLRIQATSALDTLDAMVYLSNDASFGTSTTNQTLGADVAGSKGTDVDPGGVDNTKGAYVSLGTTTNEYNLLFIMMGNSDNNGQTRQQYLVDIASGGAPAVEIGDILFNSDIAENASQGQALFHTISTATELHAACQSSDAVLAGVGDRLMDVSIVAFKLDPPSGGGGMIVHPGMSGGMRG